MGANSPLNVRGTIGPVIVWETGDLLIGRLRRSFDRAGVRPILVRTARECLQSLAGAPVAAVVIEATSATAADVLFGLWAIQATYPRGVAMAVLQRGCESLEATLREHGAIDVAHSPRRLEAIASLAIQHATANANTAAGETRGSSAARPASWFDSASE